LEGHTVGRRNFWGKGEKKKGRKSSCRFFVACPNTGRGNSFWKQKKKKKKEDDGEKKKIRQRINQSVQKGRKKKTARRRIRSQRDTSFILSPLDSLKTDGLESR